MLSLQFSNNNEQLMSHIEIAKLGEKRSDNVKRVLEKLVSEGGIQAPQIEERRNPRAVGVSATQIHYMLNRLDSITLMATINPRFCAALVKRWDELESGQAEPHYKIQHTQNTEFSLTRLANLNIDALGKLAPTYRHMMDVGREFCHNINQQRAFANQATAKLTGINCLELGIPEIMSDPQAIPERLDQPQLEQEPISRKSSPRKPHSKRTLREKNKYDLKNFFSIRELGEQTETSTEYARRVLLKHRIIKHVKPYASNSGKYVMTSKGFKLGMMYDPSTQVFHDASSKRINTSNAQPVFGYDVLRFFLGRCGDRIN